MFLSENHVIISLRVENWPCCLWIFLMFTSIFNMKKEFAIIKLVTSNTEPITITIYAKSFYVSSTFELKKKFIGFY